ncbi:MAG: hypothetical protein QGH55_02515 [Acidimicrobiales bacterium]|jgi:hypothetical protein|nr:hypothetical protein [Acidimicrobiales bacterium]|tara:strand:+ start:29 stop:370 length:342 start_codon:yes stop_codon:yes gene_type:complete
MGQPITVVERPSSRAGVVRFEMNRSLTGMGHERFTADQEISGDEPAHELARRLFERGGISRLHMNSNVVTVELADPSAGSDGDGIADVIASLYTYYVEGVEVPSDEELTGDAG